MKSQQDLHLEKATRKTRTAQQQITAATQFDVDLDIDIDVGTEGLKDLISTDPIVYEGLLLQATAMNKPPINKTCTVTVLDRS